MIKVIVINFGFAEDGQLSHSFFTTDKPFASEREACLDLAQSLFEKFKNDKTDYGRFPAVELSEEAFSWYLYKLGQNTCNDFGDEIRNWWPWHSFRDIMKFKSEEFCVLDSFTLHEGRAEDYLAYLIFEEKNIERIKNCKRCGGLGYSCSHAKDRPHFFWNCCTPLWEKPTDEIKEKIIARCKNK